MELPEWVLGSEVEKVGVRGRKSPFQGEAAWRLCGWIPAGEGIFFSTMPTYEYVCEKCGVHLDIFQSMKDAALKTCPKDKCPKKNLLQLQQIKRKLAYLKKLLVPMLSK